MKVVFVDCDGVLNGAMRWPVGAPRQYLDPECVRRLNAITYATGAAIVLSSTWRRFWDVAALFEAAGVQATIVGSTPYLEGLDRGCEIESWLDKHRVDAFVILDDDSDMGPNLADKLVKSTWALGLEDEHVAEAIEKLTVVDAWGV